MHSSINCKVKSPYFEHYNIAYTNLLNLFASNILQWYFGTYSEFWLHLEKLSAMTSHLTVQARKLSPRMKKALQQQLEYFTDRQISVLEWELISSQEELSLQMIEIEESLKTVSVPVHMAVLYLLEGFLPLLSGFSSKICAHIGGQNRACIEASTPQKMQLLFQFHKTLQVRSMSRKNALNDVVLHMHRN